MKHTRSEVLHELRSLKPGLFSRYKVKSIGLFGSFARGDNNDNSDVDILVEVDPSIGLEFISLAEELEKGLGLPVDLVSKRAVQPRALAVIQRDLVYV
jgi:predicted nucleotidyltransferase